MENLIYLVLITWLASVGILAKGIILSYNLTNVGEEICYDE